MILLKIKYFILIIFTLIIHPESICQKQANIWYFGTIGYGLDFSEGDPILTTGHRMRATAGCTSICDKDGNLLFYTNGGSIRFGTKSMGGLWNQSHFRMKGSEDFFSGKIGSSNSQQAAIAFLKPESVDTYCLFTIESGLIFANNDISRGLTYSEIDMKGDRGLGEVVLSDKNISIYALENMVAALHQNGQDYWLITTHYNHKLRLLEGFDSFLVTKNGIASEAIFSEVSLSHQTGVGVLKLSPDGKMLMSIAGKFFYFNNSSGKLDEISEINEIFMKEKVAPGAFSPNSRFVYGFDVDGFLVQYDLLIRDSKVIISENTSGTYDIQIGPNGKIYLFDRQEILDSMGISVINCPNLKGKACNFQSKIVSFPFTAQNEFPEFPEHIFAYEGPLFVDLGPDTTVCPGDSIILSLQNGSTNYLWPDGSQGNSFIITQPGWYWVDASNECGTMRDSILVRGFENVGLSLGEDTTICEGETVSIRPLLSGNYSYSNFVWQDSSTNSSFLASKDQWYTLSVDYVCGTLKDSVKVCLEDCSCQFFLPSAFTPNNDGLNDVFSPTTACELSRYSLIIYNRWGNRIFKSSELENPWRGEKVSEGVYVWVLNYQYVDQHERLRSITRQGTVTLFR